MNAPHERQFFKPESQTNSAEMLVPLNSEQKKLLKKIHDDVGSDMAFFKNSIEVLDQKDVLELEDIYTQAGKVFEQIVPLINELEADDFLESESDIEARMEKITELYNLFTISRLDLMAGLFARGHDIIEVNKGDEAGEIKAGENTESTLDFHNPVADEPEVSVVARDVSVPDQINPRVPEPEVVNSSTTISSEVVLHSSVEADVNNEGIEALADMYRSGNERVFLNPGTEQRKNLRKKIVREIILVLKHEGHSQEKIGHFQNEVLNRLVKSIKDKYSRLHHLKSIKTTDSADLDEISTSIDSDYKELLNAVRDFLQTEKVVTEEVVEVPETPEADIDDQISSATAEYQELRDRFREAGLRFSKSAAIKEIGHIQDRIDSIYERDLVVAKNKKQTYLKLFLSEIENLKREIEQAIKTKPLPAKIKIPPIAPSGPKVEAEEEVLQTNDEASNLDLVSSDLLVKGDSGKIEQTVTEDGASTPEVNSGERSAIDYTEAVVEPTASNESTSVVGKTVLEERMLNAYQLNKIKAREAKKVFIEKESVYHERLRNYYENQSLLSKAYGGTKKLFGLKPKLPMELEKMQLEYKEARKLYASSLNDALTKRGFAHVGNKEFIADSDTSKRAFGTKFILRPNQELLNVQLEVVKDQETKSRFKRIVKFATKNKTLTRGLGLVAASGIGAVTGLGAGLGAARWLASTTAGVAVAGYTAKKMQAGVDMAGVKSQEARNKAVEDYSLIDFDSLESAILDADFAKSRAELRQTATVVGTAVAVGGVAGLGTSYIPDATPSVTLTSIEGVGNNSENIVPVGLRTSIPAEAITRADGIDEYLTPSQQSAGRNFLDGDIVFQQETPRSPYLYPPQTSPDSFNIVPENISANNVVDIDAPNSVTEAGSRGKEIVEIEGMDNEVVEEVETKIHQYQVRSGDTIWSIIEQQYAQELQGLSASKKMEILDRLFERIQADPELIDSLGLRSGDIDLIYANENINLGGIDEEMDKLLGGEETIAEFKKSASIPVVADNTTVDIPIKVIVEEIPAIEDDVVSHPTTIEDVSVDINGQGEVVSEIREIPKPPRPFSVDGNYFEHPDYKKYIEGTFKSQKSFDLILDRVIEKIDNETYDAFNRDIYDSPYSYFGDKTLEEIEKFQERSNSEVRAIMQVNNIKYETYLAWLDLVDEMKDKLPYKSQTRLSDLFSRHVAENLVTQPKLVK